MIHVVTNTHYFPELFNRDMIPEGRHVNFAWDRLRSYFDKPQKNEIHLLY